MYKKWEYKRELTNGRIITEEKLNELGADGWENYDHDANAYLFKRQAVTEIDPRLTPMVASIDNAPTLTDKPKNKNK